MAPDPVSDLYVRYKTGTKRVIDWLATTAATYTTLDAALETRVPGTCTTTLTVQDLLKLANCITEHASEKRRHPAELESIIIILRDVIAGRREYALYRQRQDTVLEADRSHAYFVEILCQILDKLRALLETAFRKAPSGKKKTTKGKKQRPQTVDEGCGDVLRNIFGALDLEEPPEPLAQKEQAVSPEPMPKNAMTPVYILEQQDSEPDFALWCFLEDCCKIQRYLRSVWEEHYAGDITQLVAAQTTEVAFRIFEHAAGEFAADFPELSSLDKVIEHLGLDGEALSEHPSEVELLCIPAIASINKLRKYFHSILGVRKTAAQSDKQARAPENPPPVQQLHELLLRLSVPPEYMKVDESDGDMASKFLGAFLIASGNSGLFTDLIYSKNMHDLFFRHVWDALCDPDSPLSMQIVMQYRVCMDIGWAQGKPSTNEFDSLLYTKRYADATLINLADDTEDYLGKEVASSLTGSPCRAVLKRLISELHEVLEDKRDLPIEDIRSIPLMAPMITSLPMLAGKYANKVLLAKCHDGVTTALQRNYTMVTAHLYRACRDLGLLPNQWEDMEFVIRHLDPKNLGLIGTGGGINAITLSARRFGMAFGIPATEYSQERRRLKGGNPRLPLPRNHVIKRSKDSLPHAAFVNALMKLGDTEDSTVSTYSGINRALQSMVDDVVQDPSLELDPEIREQWKKCKKLEPTKLLTVLKQQLVREEHQTLFDYHSFFTECLTICSLIRDEYWDSIRSLRAARGLPVDFDIVEMADEILWEAAEAEGRSLSVLRGTMLGSIAQRLEGHISRQGNICIRIAEQVRNSQLYGGAEEAWPPGMFRDDDFLTVTQEEREHLISYQASAHQRREEYHQRHRDREARKKQD
ncbi:hypothetical protein HII31_09309 [Pseudocercospora fuligena]|uniref:DUF6604 domain-containing protein n=1 Tax=Pseudocercospora fuligena TaxID=685502 RepID=A0A8H6RB35_9PEZI|nr:hypothetical protein HII31_09309 [Pseudocercospora fuligena]